MKSERHLWLPPKIVTKVVHLFEWSDHPSRFSSFPIYSISFSHSLIHAFAHRSAKSCVQRQFNLPTVIKSVELSHPGNEVGSYAQKFSWRRCNWEKKWANQVNKVILAVGQLVGLVLWVIKDGNITWPRGKQTYSLDHLHPPVGHVYTSKFRRARGCFCVWHLRRGLTKWQ